MVRRLFIVEDAFFIKGRGLVTVPGIVPEGDERFRVGDSILLKRPDGTRLEWTIGGLEIIHCTPRRQTNDVFILLKGLNKEDVPVGSEVWSVHTPDPPSAVSGDS